MSPKPCHLTAAELRLYRWLLDRPNTRHKIVRELAGTFEARTEVRVRRDLVELEASGFTRAVRGFGFVWCDDEAPTQSAPAVTDRGATDPPTP